MKRDSPSDPPSAIRADLPDPIAHRYPVLLDAPPAGLYGTYRAGANRCARVDCPPRAGARHRPSPQPTPCSLVRHHASHRQTNLTINAHITSDLARPTIRYAAACSSEPRSFCSYTRIHAPAKTPRPPSPYAQSRPVPPPRPLAHHQPISPTRRVCERACAQVLITPAGLRRRFRSPSAPAIQAGRCQVARAGRR